MDLASLIIALVNVAVVMFVLLNLAGMLTWVERKQGALMANRIGADRAYIPLPVPKKGTDGTTKLGWTKRFTLIGLFHTIADGGKMILKEDFRPPFVDKVIYTIAPWFAVVPVFVAFAVVPYGGSVQPGHLLDGLADKYAFIEPARDALYGLFGSTIHTLQVADLDIGILFVFAVGSMGVFAAALAGWSSNNKFSLLGALRASAQMISYEVFVGLSVLPFFMLHGSLDLGVVSANQSNDIWLWGIIAQFPMLFVFLAGNMAENKRVPFDMPENESELVAGYMTEYSAMKMGLFMMSEFIEIAVISGLVATLFLGGYSVPGLLVVEQNGLLSGTLFGTEVSHLTVVILHVLSFWTKVIALSLFQILIRWTVPKFRYDQVMYLGWRIMLPLCIVNLLVTAGMVAFEAPAWAVGVGSLVAFVIAVTIGSKAGSYAKQSSEPMRRAA